MTCDEITQSDIVEQYLLGRLELAARDEFDEHLFECDECFDRVQTVRALRRELAATAAERRRAPATAARGWIWNWNWKLVLAPTLAALVIAVGVSLWPRAIRPGDRVLSPGAGNAASSRGPGTSSGDPAPTPPVTVALAELGRFEPPTYAPASLRGIQDEATTRFLRGMQHYADRDYRAAVADLRAAVRLDPESAHAMFFLGVSSVLTGQLDEGIRALRQTISVGDSPYLEEAHFYLAKAFLQNHDPAQARQEIERTIRLRGPLENESRQLLAALDRWQARQP
jgi:anti-sigma factor RsiW